MAERVFIRVKHPATGLVMATCGGSSRSAEYVFHRLCGSSAGIVFLALVGEIAATSRAVAPLCVAVRRETASLTA